MKQIILFFILTTSLFSQVDSMRVTWTDPADSDLDSLRLYADTVATPTTYRANIDEGVQTYSWKPPHGGLWRVGLKAVDDSSNLSVLSNIDTVTIWRDSLPSQFTFHDSTGAAVSTQIISGGVVLSGFDSAQATVTGGDYRLSVLSAWTRSPSFASTGDTLWAVDTSSASNLTKTDVIVTIAGTVKDTFSVTTESGSSPYLTDSLKFYYDDDSLSNGAIASWPPVVGSQNLVQANADYKPTMTDSGLVFVNGDEAILVATPAFAVDSIFTLEVVVQVADSTHDQFLFGVVQSSPYLLKTTLGLSTNILFVRTYSNLAGSDLSAINNYYSSPVHQKMKHLVFTSNGNGTLKLYINGSEATVIAGTTSGLIFDASIAIGELGGAEPSAGTVVRLFRFYNREFTSDNVTTNYNSTSVTSKGIE